MNAGLPTTARPPIPVLVELPITLGQFIKLAGFASTGGHAKRTVEAGLVLVNGSVETRRGRKLAAGDIVKSGNDTALVAAAEATAGAAGTDLPSSDPAIVGRSHPSERY